MIAVNSWLLLYAWRKNIISSQVCSELSCLCWEGQSPAGLTEVRLQKMLGRQPGQAHDTGQDAAVKVSYVIMEQTAVIVF